MIYIYDIYKQYMYTFIYIYFYIYIYIKYENLVYMCKPCDHVKMNY